MKQTHTESRARAPGRRKPGSFPARHRERYAASKELA